jgi:hypothetical protein
LAVFGPRPPVLLEEHLYTLITQRVLRHETGAVPVERLLVVITKTIDDGPTIIADKFGAKLI